MRPSLPELHRGLGQHLGLCTRPCSSGGVPGQTPVLALLARASLPPELMLSLARPSLAVPRRPCASHSCCPFLDCLGSRRLCASNGRVSLVLVSQFCTIPRGLGPRGGVGSPSLLHRVVSSRHTGSLAHLGVSEQCIPGGDSWRPVRPPSPRRGPLRDPPGLG